MGWPARPLAALATAALVLAIAPAVSAQSGNGLYEPFPKAAVEKRAKRFVDRLRFGEPLRFSDTQLERGVFVGSEAAQRAARGEASARAGVDEGKSDVPLAAQILLIALAIAALPLLAGRRPRRRVAPG
jgi:hypothetical protein